jgi:hypothetical protein
MTDSSRDRRLGPRRLLVVIAGVAALATPVQAAVDVPTSTVLAKDLVKTMVSRQLQSYAVEDPAEPDRFVAVLAYPGVQVLVIAARSTSPEYLRAQIKAGEYMNVYTSLSASGVAETKLFIQDMGGDGLSRDADSVDVMYERGTDRVLFDGNGRASRLSKAAYDAKVDRANRDYGRLLKALLNGLDSDTGR